MLTYDGQQFMGVTQIAEKLNTLPKVRHNPLNVDLQPTMNGVLCVVVGDLYVDEGPNPIKFSQIFHIIPNQTGQYYCTTPSSSLALGLNDIFRLNIS